LTTRGREPRWGPSLELASFDRSRAESAGRAWCFVPTPLNMAILGNIAADFGGFRKTLANVRKHGQIEELAKKKIEYGHALFVQNMPPPPINNELL
jgi:hypothetical protein